MSLSWLGGLMPYFVIVWQMKKYNFDGAATLKIRDTELKGRVQRMNNGEWLFVEDISELLQKKVKAQNALRAIESQLEKYADAPKEGRVGLE